MNAYEIPNLRFSAEAAAAVARRRFVKIDSNGLGVQCVAGDAAVGVSMNAPALGEVLEIADGIVMVEAGAAVAAGAAVESDANGKAITLVAVTKNLTGDAQTITVDQSKKIGTAMTAAAASGELIAVKMC